ncbi:DUF397 domain-containing protein [Actinomadura xylanilytica]|uniref:DUF397 domain-containing protein n=1 Tax=Actinomadura xylanilytica TaxID=887459 RepID=UPI0032E3AF3D
MKSTRCGGGQDCVEVARNMPGVVAVRDSSDPHGPALVFDAGTWRVFTERLRGGRS